MSYIEPKNGSTIEIGGLTKYMRLINSPLLQAEAPLLVQAADLVGQCRPAIAARLGGNIANASPAGDILPPLLALNASVTLVSTTGERTLPLPDLLQGPGKTALAPHEVIHHISLIACRPTPNPYSQIGQSPRHGHRRGERGGVIAA